MNELKPLRKLAYVPNRYALACWIAEVRRQKRMFGEGSELSRMVFLDTAKGLQRTASGLGIAESIYFAEVVASLDEGFGRSVREFVDARHARLFMAVLDPIGWLPESWQCALFAEEEHDDR